MNGVGGFGGGCRCVGIKANARQMLSDDLADFSDDGRHVSAARLKISATRVEHRAQFLHQELNIPTFPEYRADDAGQGDNPLKVFHIFGIDEHFERSALFVRRSGIEDDVIDGDIDCMLEKW